jgi:hypothetical protein
LKCSTSQYIVITQIEEEAEVPKYMLIYKGEATDVAAMSEEQAAEVMAKWGAWMGKVGPALSDVGSPFGPGRSVVDDGSTGIASGLTGYSIVEAGSLDAAQQLTDGHPYLSEGAGHYSIELFELMPVPFEEG